MESQDRLFLSALETRINTLSADMNDLRSYVDHHDEAVTRGFTQQVTTAHDALNERLVLKDKWIQAELTGAHAQIDLIRSGIREMFASEKMRTDAEHSAIHILIDGLQHSHDVALTNHKTAHAELHAAANEAQVEFKKSSQERIAELASRVDLLRLDSAKFITRDVHQSSVESINKVIEAISESLREKIDSEVGQLRTTINTKTEGLDTRVQRNETAVSTLSARFSQSVLILGLALGAMQLIIRFFSPG